jgi:hypothetical protein
VHAPERHRCSRSLLDTLLDRCAGGEPQGRCRWSTSPLTQRWHSKTRSGRIRKQQGDCLRCRHRRVLAQTTTPPGRKTPQCKAAHNQPNNTRTQARFLTEQATRTKRGTILRGKSELEKCQHAPRCNPSHRVALHSQTGLQGRVEVSHPHSRSHSGMARSSSASPPSDRL